ncbi:TetR/AcrR family transcriptional regulator [Paraburkholderia pallida]|uniref:TetR/AcrR family transcriptional regulator n=1 Tax=Paraburkholderia pallida TaxID=2547399 RepID=UPI001431F0DC|nr:TetR/AcrR family transcriptional regulator [Paraburkholderia pallida]
MSALEARKVILESAVALAGEDGFESVSLARLARHAGLHKMAIYRAFGSREALLEACVAELCQRERNRWKIMASCIDQQSSMDQRERDRVVEVMADLVVERLSASSIKILASQSMAEDHPHSINLREHEQAFRALLLTLAHSAGVPNREALADTLMLVCRGVALTPRVELDAQHVDQRIRDLSLHIILSYADGIGGHRPLSHTQSCTA